MKPAEKPFSRRLNNVINHPTDLSTPVQSRSRISGHGVSQTWRKEPESDAQSVPESDARSVGVSVPSTADSLESQLQSLQSAIRQLQPHRHHHQRHVHHRSSFRRFPLLGYTTHALRSPREKTPPRQPRKRQLTTQDLFPLNTAPWCSARSGREILQHERETLLLNVHGGEKAY